MIMNASSHQNLILAIIVLTRNRKTTEPSDTTNVQTVKAMMIDC